jgi:hypothetical protein
LLSECAVKRTVGSNPSLSVLTVSNRIIMKTTEITRILTLHPEGKAGVHVDRNKYLAMRAAILRALRTSRGMGHTELLIAARHRLPRGFKGSIPWYHETVKLDLEARGLIHRQSAAATASYRLATAPAKPSRKKPAAPAVGRGRRGPKPSRMTKSRLKRSPR